MNNKLNSSCITQVPDKTMHSNSGHFVHPDFEPFYVPCTHAPIPDVLMGKLFCKVPMHTSYCESDNGDKTMSAANALLRTFKDVEKCVCVRGVSRNINHLLLVY